MTWLQGATSGSRARLQLFFEVTANTLVHRRSTLSCFRPSDAMPVYGFSCVKCNKLFEIVRPTARFDSKKVKCPSCGSSSHNVFGELAHD